MELIQHDLQVLKKVRYFTLGDPSISHSLLFILHGYGQLPAFFIKKFEQFANEGYYVVAPEGFHRFYLKGSSGRVGASWMTREARLDDINDTSGYLSALIKQITHSFSFSKKVLLGFSQGGATAVRLIENEACVIDHLILWASVFPPDCLLDFKSCSIPKLDFVLGFQDEYFSLEDQLLAIKRYRELGFVTHQFHGKHAVDLTVLKSLIEI